MKLHTLNRKVHYWGSLIVALPILIVICSGLLLQLKKQLTWVQPPEQRGTAQDLRLDFPRILAICQTVPEAQIQSWEDISRLDVRPGRGLLKVAAKNNYEIQLDTATGKVLQVAYRRSDLIEALHDGSWFHDAVKLWVFLPSAIVLLGLWVTGIYLFWLPIGARRRRGRDKQTGAKM